MRGWLAGAWGLPAEAVRTTRDAHGRPQLDGGPHHADVNWSHSGDWLIAAATEGARVGIDLEMHRPRPKALALARRFFAVEEAQALAALADDPDALETAFTRLWCAKEAVLKAHGRGLSFGLHRLRFALDAGDAGATAPRLVACDPALGLPADWHLRAWAPVPGYLATLAWCESTIMPA